MTIRIRNLTLSIATKKICNTLNVVFERGELWAILGVNGVGKSTLLHSFIDVASANSDEILIDDLTLKQYRHKRQLLAQKTGILLQDYEYNFPCTVMEAVLVGRHPFIPHWQWESEADMTIAESSLRQTRLKHMQDRTIQSLSGGEKRRLNLATLLTQNPDFMLLDEPTNHLDLNSQISILELIASLVKEQNKSAIMVMHDANLAKRFCDKVLMLFGEGEWLAGPTSELINVENLQKLYGCSIQAYSNGKQTAYLPG